MAGAPLIWINGDFGVGKTTLAHGLRERFSGAVVYDPEYLGYLVRDMTADEIGDFQDCPVWADLLVASASVCVTAGFSAVLMPMSILDVGRHNAVAKAIQESVDELVEILLVAEDHKLRTRILSDCLYPDDPARDQSAREWRLSKVGRAGAIQVGSYIDLLVLETSNLSREQVCEAAIAALAGRVSL